MKTYIIQEFCSIMKTSIAIIVAVFNTRVKFRCKLQPMIFIIQNSFERLKKYTNTSFLIDQRTQYTLKKKKSD